MRFIVHLSLSAFLLQDATDSASQDSIRILVDRLSSDAVDARETAENELMSLAPKDLPHLRRMFHATKDAEVQVRLAKIIRHLVDRNVVRSPEARALYKSGKVGEALLLYAKTKGALDPKKYVKYRVALAKKDLLAKKPRSQVGFRMVASVQIAKDIRKEEIPWAMGALVEMFDVNDKLPVGRLPLDTEWNYAIDILTSLHLDGKPVLISALNNGNSATREKACDLIEGLMVPFFPKFQKPPPAFLALKNVASDPSEDASVRKKAEELRRSLTFPNVNKEDVDR